MRALASAVRMFCRGMPSGWGAPGHYPIWLPAYCAQAVARDVVGQPRYQLLEQGQGDVIVDQLRASGEAESDTSA